MTAPAPVTYTAICERVGHWWEITVPELDEVTQARTLDEVPATVADLVALMTDTDPASVKVKVEASTRPNSSGNLELVGMLLIAAAIIAWRMARSAVRVPGRGQHHGSRAA